MRTPTSADFASFREAVGRLGEYLSAVRRANGRRGVGAPLLNRIVVTLLTVALIAFAPPAARADEPFYAGKRLTILINFAAGGATDVEGRLFAKYIGRHIAGHPNVVVQNMDGAGGVTGARYLGELAPKDGSIVGYFTATAFIYALDPARFRANFKAYDFVAVEGGTTVYFVRSDVPPGMKEATDIAKAKDLVVGGLSVDTPKDLRMRFALDMLGVPYKYVTGYRSSPPALLALQKGEISMFSESAPSYRSNVKPNLIDTGLAIPVWYDADYAGGSFKAPSQLAGLSILPFHELYRKIKGKLPSGRLWDVYRAVAATDSTMLRMICFPPGTPSAAHQALADAIAALDNDKDHAAEALRTIGFVPEWQVGPAVNGTVQSALSMPADVREVVTSYIKSADK